ncbi:PDZ domain containing protein [Aphelenchoides avenae]|nr:PDZ domain containing protein [Aphelenchus avenae]
MPSLSAEDQKELAATQNTRHVTIRMSVDQNDEMGVTLSQNLQVKSIKATSKAIWQLIIGDQILAVNGHVPTNMEEAHTLIKDNAAKLELLVSRKECMIEPVPRSRAATIMLHRRPGYSYFVARLKKIGKVHMGLSLKTQGKSNRITVVRVDENSLAACAYMVGDVILDLNHERVSDIATLKKLMVDSLNKWNYCTSVVERPDSAMAIYNTNVMVRFPEIDPPVAPDVVAIGQREAMRIRAGAHQKRTIKSIYRGERYSIVRHSSSGTSSETPAVEEPKPGHQEQPEAGTKRESKADGTHSNGHQDESGKKKRRHKHVSVNTTMNEDSQIASDVPNPHLLQKVPSSSSEMDRRFVSTLTFMPKFFSNLR